jgi:hypothetical protein
LITARTESTVVASSSALRGFAIVVFEHPTEPLAALDLPDHLANLLTRCDHLVLKSLVIPLGVVVLEATKPRNPR